MSLSANIRMFYPTCYVYKIASADEPLPSNETSNKSKKPDVSSAKKSKTPAASTNPTSTTINNPLDLISNVNKNENLLIKNLSNQLLISAQRQNCVDLEKK